MGFSDDIDNEFNAILSARDKLATSSALNLHSDLVEASPVDEGELRASWQLPKKTGLRSWIISNTAPHAIPIDGGRREVIVNGTSRMIGSDQLKDGFDPIVRITEKQIQKDLNKL